MKMTHANFVLQTTAKAVLAGLLERNTLHASFLSS